MHLVWVVTLLAAAPIRLAASNTQITNVDAKTAAGLQGQLAQELALQKGILVTTPDEMSSVLGLERQKSLLGCTAQSCTAELAGALGVDGVVLSTIALLGKTYVLNVKVIAATNTETLAVVTKRVQGIDALVEALSAAAKQVGDTVRKKLHPKEPEVAAVVEPQPQVSEPAPEPVVMPAPAIDSAPVSAVSASSNSHSKVWLVPVAIGAAAMIAGGIAYGFSKDQEARIRAGYPADVDAAIATGRTEQTVGVVAFVVGAAALVGGIVWAVVNGSSSSPSAWLSSPGDNSFALVRWP